MNGQLSGAVSIEALEALPQAVEGVAVPLPDLVFELEDELLNPDCDVDSVCHF